MVAAFKANNNNEDDIAESDTESVTLQESEELFLDQDELDKGASYEVDNFHMWEISPKSICGLEAFWTAPAYSRSVKSALAIVKKVNKSCRATWYS